MHVSPYPWNNTARVFSQIFCNVLKVQATQKLVYRITLETSIPSISWNTQSQLHVCREVYNAIMRTPPLIILVPLRVIPNGHVQ